MKGGFERGFAGEEFVLLAMPEADGFTRADNRWEDQERGDKAKRREQGRRVPVKPVETGASRDGEGGDEEGLRRDVPGKAVCDERVFRADFVAKLLVFRLRRDLCHADGFYESR